MSSGDRVRLAALFGALALFADLADGFPDERVLRTVVLAMRLARAAGASLVPDSEHRDIYYATLLRYAGCVGFTHEEAHEFGAGDDGAVRNTMAMADATNPVRTVKDIVLNVGRGMPFVARVRGIARLLGDKSAVARHARAHCDTALWLARTVGSSASVLASLEQICERFDGRGEPHGATGPEIRLAMRVSHVADIAAIAFHRGGCEAAVSEVALRAGKHLDPDLARVFVANDASLFEGLDGPSIWEAFLACEPEPHATATGDEVDLVAKAFGALSDLKSVYTIGHSARVARLARAAGASLGLDATRLSRAGHLHDLGRVAISNAVWDRPGRLSVAERERVQMHAYYTERILRRAGALSDVAALAGGAHERSNGTGYPKGLGETITPASSVLAAADVLAALGEERPHRPAFSDADAKREILRMVASGELAAAAVDAVLAAAGLAGPPQVHRDNPLTSRECEVVCLLARGKSNREIGTLLGISPRTVQNHVAHAYDKLGVYSRAGATLWAVEHGLLRSN